MLFGKEAIVLDNRAGGEADKDEEGYAKEEYLPGSDEVIGQMAEYQKAGKLLIGGTAGCDGIIEEGYEYKTTYNYLSGGVAFEDHAPVSDGHTVCITEVDMKNRTVKLADTMVENGEVDCAIKTLTFGQFRRYFTKVYVVDGPR